MARRVGVRVLWLVSLTQRLSRCLWTMVRPSRRRAPFGLQGGLIPLLVRADRRVMRAHTMENLQPKVCNMSFGSCKSVTTFARFLFPCGHTLHFPCVSSLLVLSRGRRGGGTVSESQIMLASQTRVIIRRTTSRVRRADNSSTPRQLNWRQSTKKTFTRERAKRTAAR